MQIRSRETATLKREGVTRSPSDQFEAIQRAREARPECCKCNAKRAVTFRVIEESSLVVGLCATCNSVDGEREARALAAAGRCSLDRLAAILERR
jgi:hypothetical protein